MLMGDLQCMRCSDIKDRLAAAGVCMFRGIARDLMQAAACTGLDSEGLLDRDAMVRNTAHLPIVTLREKCLATY